jgi:hypothetical protein
VNRFDAYITDYLYENKEVALEKIGFLKVLSFASADTPAVVNFIFDRRITTSTALIEYIAEKAVKNKNLVAADLESHFSQVREFINIGKNYELPEIGFIKANRTGVYEFTPFSESNKPARTGTQQVKRPSQQNNRTVIQLISLIIAVAILSGLGWQVYQVFSKKQNATSVKSTDVADTLTKQTTPDTVKTDSTIQKPAAYSPDDTINVRYIYETTASGLRARTRTAQLKNFGNNATYDSFTMNNTKYFHLYLIEPTKIADTARVRDSLSKFLMRDVKIVIDSVHQ